MSPWHTVRLTEEFTASRADSVESFEDYVALEDRLFTELQEEIYTRVGTGPEYEIARYSAGSEADPQGADPNWNRSFEWPVDAPVGGVVLLHGMSDSPYSLRALAETLRERGYWVIGLRLPGHGTAPSGLKYVSPDDMREAVKIAVRHLSAEIENRPIHLVGYSTGAALALDYALDAAEGALAPAPASLILISPAIRIHSAAGLARFKNALSVLPGLGGLAWLQVLPEFDPYKYNSFATNAGDVVHRLTRDVDARIAARADSDPVEKLPPILVFKSAVDSTVSTEAVVDRLLAVLPPDRHELVLFDINQSASTSKLLISEPDPLTYRLMGDDSLPFAVTFVTNESPKSRAVVARRKEPFSPAATETTDTELDWPPAMLSLSHVALPFPADDPLYGRRPPENQDDLFLGEMALQSERGLILLPGDWLLRTRFNPFYDVLETRVLDWFESARQAADEGA